MHHGVMAVKAPWDRFFAELSGMTGRFLPRGDVGDLERVDLDPKDDGFTVVGGEKNGQSFLLDTSMMLSGGSFDRLADLSRRLNCTVATCVGETVSGTFCLFVAEAGSVKRLYYNCVSAIREPFSLGAALPSEARHPLEDVDGLGLLEALREQGLDYFAWVREGSKHQYLYTCDEVDKTPPPPKGQVQLAFDEHWKRHEYPKGHVPAPPQVVRRVLPDGSTGFDIVAQRPLEPRRGWLRRLFGR
jgi:hypothetical protein